MPYEHYPLGVVVEGDKENLTAASQYVDDMIFLHTPPFKSQIYVTINHYLNGIADKITSSHLSSFT